MGDRATLLFADISGDEALITLHTEGSRVPELMAEFFQAEDDNTAHDNRYDDPSYLAARFVAWMAGRYPRGNGIGVGNPAYQYDGPVYRIQCNTEQWPDVEKAYGSDR